MSEPSESQKSVRTESARRKGVYTLRINYSDGSAAYPVMINSGTEDWEAQLTEAERYFEKVLDGKGYITVHFADNVYDTGVNDLTNLLKWKDYKKKHNIE